MPEKRFAKRTISSELDLSQTLEELNPQGEKPLSKHDTATKRHRHPKSDKRVDYTVRTMAALRKLELAEKAKK